jgi:4-hydroxybenzoate polyprenyltransferase
MIEQSNLVRTELSTRKARGGQPVSHTSNMICATRSWRFHLKSIWLFTYSDLKTIIAPKTIFGILNALAAPVYEIPSKDRLRPLSIVLVTFWVWINLLPFVIDNQRRSECIQEDKKNKSWRPLPSNRMSQAEAKRVILILYPIAFTASVWLGGYRQSAALVVLGHWYNCRGGAAGVFSKNFINACGFVCFASGAMEVSLGLPLPSSPLLVTWFLIIWAVVLTTVQTQDLPDQEGDLLCGRTTVPIALGDSNTRYLTAGFMCIWALFCPFYWKAPVILYASFASLGLLISLRCLFRREIRHDKKTFQMWNFWMVVLYGTPLFTQWSRSQAAIP